MAAALKLALPRFTALQSDYKNGYLGYIHENETFDGYLNFRETQAVSPYAKFEVETAGKDDLRSCQNNKYWERTKNPSIRGDSAEQYWITATAKKPEEKQSKESCTLFKPIYVHPAMNTVRIMHVQSGCYLCLWRSSDTAVTRFVLANSKDYDQDNCDVFTIIDWDSLLLLPNYVAFKGNRQ